jgi:hypothetical protein
MNKNGTLQHDRVPFLRKVFWYYGFGMKTKGVAPVWKAWRTWAFSKTATAK